MNIFKNKKIQKILSCLGAITLVITAIVQHYKIKLLNENIESIETKINSICSEEKKAIEEQNKKLNDEIDKLYVYIADNMSSIQNITRPLDKDDLISIDNGTDEEILAQLNNLFNYVSDPFVAKNGNTYRIVGDHNKFGIFNVTKLIGTKCIFENIKVNSKTESSKIGYADNYLDPIYSCFRHENTIRFEECFFNPIIKNPSNRNLVAEGITDLQLHSFIAPNGTCYAEVDNLYGDYYDFGLFNLDSMQEETIPSGTYTSVEEISEGIYRCTTEDNNTILYTLKR